MPKTKTGERRKPGRAPRETPASFDMIRRQERALTLRALGLGWTEIAAYLWPRDENDEPLPKARPLFNSPQAAAAAYDAAIKTWRQKNAEAIMAEVAERIRLRTGPLMEKAMTGDTFANAAMDALEKLLMSATGTKPPDKIAMTTPDGKEAAPVVDHAAALKQVADAVARIAERERAAANPVGAVDGTASGASVPVGSVGKT